MDSINAATAAADNPALTPIVVDDDNGDDDVPSAEDVLRG